MYLYIYKVYIDLCIDKFVCCYLNIKCLHKNVRQTDFSIQYCITNLWICQELVYRFVNGLIGLLGCGLHYVYIYKQKRVDCK